MASLTSEKYRANDGSNGGFILKHSVGHKPVDSEVDVALNYADYYYLEALKRQKELMK
jgi:unsaturated chondroitin disaccharide hydrolase